ncbi:MAG: PRC-barrel domain-containing protein [Opitutaceae bacterium]|jgi:sporulation protein YlmC with PRC-barrel domain
MLQNIKELYGYKLAAVDGDIGHVKDFYFDDKTWVIRYLVADTGSWLAGCLVLLAPHAFSKLDQYEKTLHIKLNRKQIQNSPSIESHKPVSRQYEEEYYRYYGWPTYWDCGGGLGLGGCPVVIPPPRKESPARPTRADHHLQSTKAVTGYTIQTADGTIGSVNDFMVDSKSWMIRELAVETGHWYSGKEILISPGKIDRISYEESKVFVSLTMADIQRTGEYEVAKVGGRIL